MTPREMTASDRRYVVPTWARNGMTGPDRMAKVDAILDAGARVVVLASGPTVHTFAAARGDELLFVYVPFALRGLRLARRTVTELLGDYPADVAARIRACAVALAAKRKAA